MSWFDEPRTIGGIPLKGSFLMESGPFGHSGASIVACMEAGFSAVSTETISRTDGTSPWWNLYQQGETLYNCSKWSDLSLEQWVHQEIPYAASKGAVILATVGHTVEDVESIVPILDQSAIAGFKVCYYHADQIVGMVRAAKRRTNLPVWVKISANWPNFLELALACEAEGADALVAIDTLGPVAFFEEGEHPALGSPNGVGWMSGAAIHGKALYVIQEIRRHASIPIVGVGGIMDAPGVRRVRAAGADLIGLCSAVLLYGLGCLERIQSGLRMKPVWDSFPPAPPSGPAHIQVDLDRCNHCGLCVKRCGYLAFQMVHGHLHTIDRNCRRCGLCQQTCPAISITAKG